MQHWPVQPIRAVVLIVPLVFLAIVLLQPWAEPKWMFLDPLASAEHSGDCCHVYFGFVSTAGVMLWSATAAFCLFCGVIYGIWAAKAPITRFALSAGLLTGILALDDAFMVHEVVMPALGVPQNAVLASYVLLTLWYLVGNRRLLLASDPVLLLVALGALGVSVGVDTVLHSLASSIVYLEDSAKFFGIFVWTAFHATTLARSFLQPDFANAAHLRRRPQ